MNWFIKQKCKCVLWFSACVILCVAGGPILLAQPGGPGLPGGAPIGITFSVDFQGPTAGGIPGAFTGVPEGFGLFGAIDEGSILTVALPGPPGPNPPAFGPLPAPGIMVGSILGAPGSVPGGLGLVPGLPVELDALSYGRDFLPVFEPTDDGPIRPPFDLGTLVFSVDEFAFGIPGAPPDVFSESYAGAGEASADVFTYLGPIVPMPPGPPFGNVDTIDGDGLPSFGGPGTGLIEPNFPTFGTPDDGDNLDAVDVDTHLDHVAFGPIYFSLDGPFPDPFEAPVANTSTALLNGFSAADVLITTPGGAPGVYAPAPLLGLDLVFGDGQEEDDLDALALWDVGVVGVFEPGIDAILFSVRRGSAVIGMLDSLFGVPIEPGDVLSLPFVGVGAFSPYPSIFIPAEALGLATFRSGTVGQYGSDELDALDVIENIAIPTPSSLSLAVLLLLGTLQRRAPRARV